MPDSGQIIKTCDKVSDRDVIYIYAYASDERLVKASLEGDSRAFDRLFRRYQKQILSVCVKMTRGDQTQAFDLCQEAFISAYAHLSQLKEHKSFFYWVLGIAKNKCIAHARQQMRLFKMLGDYEVVGRMASRNEQQWTEAELQLVEDIIKSIKNPELRETIQLFYIEGKRIPDIAEIQGITQTAITTRLNRFRVKFRRRIVREVLK